jgi:hypothetical protein
MSLLSVWPDQGRPWPSWPSWALWSDCGDKVLYVGEGPGGCTGNYQFHRILHHEFICAGAFPMPHFYGQHDRLWVWERRESASLRYSPVAFGSMATSARRNLHDQVVGATKKPEQSLAESVPGTKPLACPAGIVNRQEQT